VDEILEAQLSSWDTENQVNISKNQGHRTDSALNFTGLLPTKEYRYDFHKYLHIFQEKEIEFYKYFYDTGTRTVYHECPFKPVFWIRLPRSGSFYQIRDDYFSGSRSRRVFCEIFLRENGMKKFSEPLAFVFYGSVPSSFHKKEMDEDVKNYGIFFIFFI
jgi:hypothetical protein